MFQRAVLLDIVMTLTDNFAKFHGKLTSAHKYFKAVIATFLWPRTVESLTILPRLRECSVMVLLFFNNWNEVISLNHQIGVSGGVTTSMHCVISQPGTLWSGVGHHWLKATHTAITLTLGRKREKRRSFPRRIQKSSFAQAKPRLHAYNAWLILHSPSQCFPTALSLFTGVLLTTLGSSAFILYFSNYTLIKYLLWFCHGMPQVIYLFCGRP